MDLGSIFGTLFSSVWRIMSLRISFTWFGSYFSFSILQVIIGVLLISLGIVLFRKLITKE